MAANLALQEPLLSLRRFLRSAVQLPGLGTCWKGRGSRLLPLCCCCIEISRPEPRLVQVEPSAFNSSSCSTLSLDSPRKPKPSAHILPLRAVLPLAGQERARPKDPPVGPGYCCPAGRMIALSSLEGSRGAARPAVSGNVYGRSWIFVGTSVGFESPNVR